MHEHAVEVSGLRRADLNRLMTPPHNLARTDVRHRRWHLAPLQDNVLCNGAVRVDVHTLVVVAQQQTEAARVGENEDQVRYYQRLSWARGDVQVEHL